VTNYNSGGGEFQYCTQRSGPEFDWMQEESREEIKELDEFEESKSLKSLNFLGR
jgi:hypothetical protein